jgi:3-hydroxyisobutyrate dehydrogenase-like beta-hydroxyacid dehydrogenase
MLPEWLRKQANEMTMFDDKIPLPHPAEPSADADGTSNRPQPTKVGFIGLGRMGSVMAANLAASGYAVSAYVRRHEQMEQLQSRGVKATPSRQDLFDSEIVISMLPDDDAVREVFFGNGGAFEAMANRMAPGSIHLSMGTISTIAAANFASEHQRRGQAYVAAPVFGNPAAAAAKQLSVIVAGPPGPCERCRPLLEQLGRVFVVGSDPAQANLIKLLGNMMTATSLEVLGEMTAVLRKSGQDPQQFMDIMTDTMFGSRVHRIYGNRIAARDYAPGLAMPLALKDVRLALAEAERAGAPMPSVSLVRDRMITAIARGHADLDWTALGLVASEEAGLN